MVIHASSNAFRRGRFAVITTTNDQRDSLREFPFRLFFPLWGSAIVTRRLSGEENVTLPFIGLDEIPLSLGRIAPSFTKQPGNASLILPSIYALIFCQENSIFQIFSTQISVYKCFSTQTGRNSKNIFSSSPAFIVRPFAGNPTKNRTVIPAL